MPHGLFAVSKGLILMQIYPSLSPFLHKNAWFLPGDRS